AEIQNTRSIGLLGMHERAGLLGGKIHLLGEPGKGTTVSVCIPLPRRWTNRWTNKIHRHENFSRR
ncbi:MAG: hypothetical protein JF609_02890, partial [Verrucomicrobia bacterium]|nr:hypothetical protein [Verrucomicrobiota bacterium]